MQLIYTQIKHIIYTKYKTNPNEMIQTFWLDS